MLTLIISLELPLIKEAKAASQRIKDNIKNRHRLLQEALRFLLLVFQSLNCNVQGFRALTQFLISVSNQRTKLT